VQELVYVISSNGSITRPLTETYNGHAAVLRLNPSYLTSYARWGDGHTPFALSSNKDNKTARLKRYNSYTLNAWKEHVVAYDNRHIVRPRAQELKPQGEIPPPGPESVPVDDFLSLEEQPTYTDPGSSLDSARVNRPARASSGDASLANSARQQYPSLAPAPDGTSEPPTQAQMALDTQLIPALAHSESLFDGLTTAPPVPTTAAAPSTSHRTLAFGDHPKGIVITTGARSSGSLGSPPPLKSPPTLDPAMKARLSSPPPHTSSIQARLGPAPTQGPATSHQSHSHSHSPLHTTAPQSPKRGRRGKSPSRQRKRSRSRSPRPRDQDGSKAHSRGHNQPRSSRAPSEALDTHHNTTPHSQQRSGKALENYTSERKKQQDRAHQSKSCDGRGKARSSDFERPK
jgi:hypothetical protein